MAAICDVVGETTLVAGPGDDVTDPVSSTSGTLLRWNVGCGNVHAPYMTGLERLEQTAQDGRMSRDLQFPVSGWRVTNRAARIRRSFVARVRPTATQRTVYPTRPTGSPLHPVTASEGDGIHHLSTKTDSFPDGWTGASGLQPSTPITKAPVRGRTTPLRKRPALGGETVGNGAPSIGGAVSTSWITVASSVLALTVVTLPTFELTMRRTSAAEESTTTAKRQTTSGSKDPDTDRRTWSAGDATKPDAERSSDSGKTGWTTRWKGKVARKGPTVGNDLVNLSTETEPAASKPVATLPADRTTTTATTSPESPPYSSKYSGTQISDTTTTSVRSRKRTEQAEQENDATTRRPPARMPPLVDHHDAPVVHRSLDRIIVSAGDVLLHRITNDTFIDYQVSTSVIHSNYYALSLSLSLKIKGNQEFWHIQKTIEEFPSI